MAQSVLRAVGALLMLAGCTAPAAVLPAGTVAGETRSLNGASVTTWARLDAAQQVSAIGATLPLAAVEGASADDQETTFLRLAFPEAVRQQTYVDHLSLDFNPHGHAPPRIYDVPHFDMHFFGLSSQEVEAIDCSQESGVTAEQIPAGYALLPPPKGMCEPKMGFHVVKLDSPELAPENPQPFTHTMVIGYYAGKFAFIEPMVTRAYLLTRQNFSHAVPKPASLGRSTRYPTTFTATYDAGTNAYQLTLSDFVAAQ